MDIRSIFINITTTLLLSIFFTPVSSEAAGRFSDWLTKLRIEAQSKGISQDTLNSALTGLNPIPRVIELDRKQPEFTQTFWNYLDTRVNEKRIMRGRQLLVEHGDLLREVERLYGVQPRFLVAFWGLETNFGDYLGSFPTVGALATLAYDARRSTFFRGQLLASLQILQEGHISVDKMKGSWAGAMGQPQFMPTTFINFAIDHNGDGRRDIWHTLPDVFASAANFLSQSGWQKSESWGSEIKLPENFNYEMAGLNTSKKVSRWQSLGIRYISGDDLQGSEETASIILPSGYSGPAFLVHNNYRTIMNWNRSHLYAISVGHLADRIVGGTPFISKRPAEEQSLSLEQVKTIQRILAGYGYNPGPADGLAGKKTRTAIKKYQRQNNLPADGYPNSILLQKLLELENKK